MQDEVIDSIEAILQKFRERARKRLQLEVYFHYIQILMRHNITFTKEKLNYMKENINDSQVTTCKSRLH